MRLRIIAGELGGRFISLNVGNASFRPTQERIRQSVAEILKFKIPGAVVADVCAGSGAFGFEMISRGAETVDFIEKDRQRSQKISENAELLGCSQKCAVYSRDIQFFLKAALRKYDIIYFDPPYDMPDSDTIIPALGELLTENGILVYEHRRDSIDRKTLYSRLTLDDSRVYGGTAIDFFVF
ncbi:MAG TPA: RsmD family RNA methyltransferase [Chitinispirillaceae bacterium]|nr:RsmD family RNA methyltransferase [Chitinispirillaceae bacterium]